MRFFKQTPWLSLHLSCFHFQTINVAPQWKVMVQDFLMQHTQTFAPQVFFCGQAYNLFCAM